MQGLKLMRKKKGYTLECLGHLLKPALTGKAVSNYERGTREPNLNTLKQLSQIFNCPIEELL